MSRILRFLNIGKIWQFFVELEIILNAFIRMVKTLMTYETQDGAAVCKIWQNQRVGYKEWYLRK